MGNWQHWIFGDVSFSQSEEYAGFRYRFLVVLIFVGALFSALFVAGEYAQLNRMENPHFWTMQGYIVASLLAWWALRGRKHWYWPMAWVYEGLSLLLFTSALWFIPDDELRLVWFYVHVSGAFIVFGPRAGWCIVAVVVAILLLSNAHMALPYSSNALVSGIASLLYLALFFHIFHARSVSYFVRMRDYNAQLQALASHDGLTGLLNSRAYHDRCQERIDWAQRSGQPYAVLFVDLDHFKHINDQHGHDAGDRVLKTVAQVLAQTVRRTDVPGRIGGEEFSVFLPDTDEAGAVKLAEVLRQAIEDCQPDIGAQRLRVTASIGVATSHGSEPGQALAGIQQRADQAMYAAKAQGRNRVSVLREVAPPVA